MYRVFAAAFTLLLALGLGVPAQVAHAAGMSEAVGKPLQEAQRLAQARNIPGALAAANRAKAAAKSQQELYTVNEMLAYIYSAARDNNRMADAIEASLRTGLVPSSQVQTKLKQVCQIRYAASQFDRALASCSEYASKYNDPTVRQWVGQIFVRQGNWAKCTQFFRPLASSGSPSKSVLQTLQSCYFKLNDLAGQQWTLERIVDAYPSATDWDALLKTVSAQIRGDTRWELDLLRLKLATGNATAGDIMNIAQLSMQFGNPGLAKTELDRALAAGKLGKGRDAPREMRLVNMARQQAAADIAGLARKAAAARAAPQGELELRLGETLVGHGRGAEGVAAIERAIGKGGLKDADEAKLRLGLAQIAAGQRDAGLRNLDAAAKGKGNFSPIARLWAIHVRNG